ncbi:pantoate--beta-alanine ligase [Rathayibacter sp. VKM Ac-2804]|uniref:pantoate--beta-alanine ligase n=1 Tax=unclassified Rathayibacter TaxID=2609250 RepID=UPI001FC96D99|nr:pantoate--beta-alanine ligase [Rathayibacter sp. VKM Ac-2804]
MERIGELRGTLQEARRSGARIALVPTMGALHAGHLALVDRAREIADVVVVSIFVNPLQFGPNEDLDRYPRDLAADVALLEERGVEHVFAPSVAEMYPDGPSSTRVVAGEVGSLYEGRSRPGHFDGMLTVVSKLLHIVQPDVAMFGQKDAQQLFLVRRMVRDLDLPVAIEGVATVREEDGLALSSRNRYLDARERRAARTIPLLLEAAASAADRGLDAVVAAAQSASRGEPLVKLDYLVVANPATLLPVDDDHRGPALVLVAAVVGSTRLLDNGPILLA